MYKLEESSIIVNFIQTASENGFELDQKDTKDVIDTVFTSISEFLGQAKNKKTKVALAIQNLKGELKLAGIVTYHPNENEDLPGNWSYEFTQDPKDLEGVTVYLSTDTQFQKVCANIMHKEAGFSVEGGAPTVQFLIESIVDCLFQWLDVNAKENEVVELSDEGYFISKVGIEDGEKVFTILPDGPMKTLIKGDAGIEK